MQAMQNTTQPVFLQRHPDVASCCFKKKLSYIRLSGRFAKVACDEDQPTDEMTGMLALTVTKHAIRQI